MLTSNQPRAIILAAGSVSIALAAASLATAAVTSRTIVGQTVDAGWRGAYDLLVQPADAMTYAVDGKQVVPSDFLAVRSSGITREQWQAILQIPGVEVAAPLATLGWTTTDTIGLGATAMSPGPDELLEIDTTITLSDGTVQRETNYLGLDYENVSGSGLPADIVDTCHDGGVDSTSVWCGLYLSLPPAWGNVVGVDPIEEDRLVSLNSFVSGDSLRRGLTTKFDQVYGLPAVRVPVVTPDRTDWPGQVSITLTRLEGVDLRSIAAALLDRPSDLKTAEDFFEWRRSTIERFTAGSQADVLGSDTASLADISQPLRGTLVIFSNGKFVLGEQGGGGSSSGRNVLLLSGSTPYVSGEHGQATLDSLGTWGELVQPDIEAARPEGWRPPPASLNEMLQYRPLAVTVPQPFIVDALGTYDLQAIDEHYAGATNYVPLGIYGDPTRRLITDTAGSTIDRQLPISLNPGGLNPLPPIGLTNLETVEALRGDHFIDAIRVRVGGIDAYTPTAVDRIAQVAQAIRDRTGLHVDVVAGSSPVDVDVAVSGVGTVRERWTTLGEAPRIVSGADGLSGLLLGGAGLVVVLYLSSFGVFLVDDQRRSLEILRKIGWRRMSRTWLLVSQAMVLGLAAGLLSVALLALFDATTEVDLPALAYPAVALAVVGAHMLAAALASITRRAQRDRTVAAPARWLSLGIVRLGLRNSLETPRRLLTVALAMALAILVSGIIAAVEIAYGGELRATALGDLVWLRVGWYHLLAAGAALFAAASIALDSGVLAVERRVAMIALLRATGWRGDAIRSVIRVEAGLPAFAGGLLALLPLVAVGAWLGLDLVVLTALATASIVLGGLVALVVAVLPSRLALAVEPARGLAAEGMTGTLPGFASRAALAVIAALALFVTGAGVGYGVLAPAAIPPNAFVPIPSPKPPSPQAQRLSAHVASIAAQPDRAPGSESLGWTIDYVSDFLRAHGASASSGDFISFKPVWLDEAGDEIDPGATFMGGLAVVPEFNIDAPLSFTAIDSTEAACVSGLMVLRASDAASATLPSDILARCESQATTAVLTVRPLAEDAWVAIRRAASVRLDGGQIVWGSVGTATDTTPLLVVPMGSTGPGAAQSAAPIAVALELAAKAEAYGLPLRLVFADVSQPGTMAILVRRVAETMPEARLIELGPLGGRLASVLGERWADPLDEVSTRRGLLGSLVLDDEAADWIARTADLTAADTSDVLLAALATTATADDVRLHGVIAPAALTVGIDAAYLGEPTRFDTDTGTPADTADQLDISALEHALAQLVSALEVLDAPTD